MHLVIDPIRASVKIPVLSLLDVVGAAVKGHGFKTVGLLGTASTMEKGFYQDAMAQQGIKVLTPEWDERKYVSDVIYKELVAGQIKDESRAGYQKIIQQPGGTRRPGSYPGLYRDPAVNQRSQTPGCPCSTPPFCTPRRLSTTLWVIRDGYRPNIRHNLPAIKRSRM